MTASHLTSIPGGGQKPGQINIDGRPLRDITAELLKAVYDNNDPPELFARAGMLVRARTDENGRPIVDTVTDPLLRHRISQVCDTVRFLAQGGIKHVPPPREVVADLLARGTWSVPPLEAVTEIPTLRPDGTVHAAPGYDPTTRLLHIPARGLQVPDVAQIPATMDLVEAVELLEDLTGDFPFDTDADRANAYAALLTPILRPAIDGHIPLALMDAPAPGTGKGLLASIVATIATGRPAAMKPMPVHEEEIRKMITSTLLDGSTIVVLDNVDDAIGSPSLASVLTADTWADRILGASEIRQLPNRATWIATGNNLRVAGDLARRCYRIRLDTHDAKPYMRTGFKHENLVSWTLRHRGPLLAALLTLARAWWADNQPPPAATPVILGGFTEWAQTIGGILHHAGVTGFLDNQLDFLETGDTDAVEWAAFLTAWRELKNGAAVTSADLAIMLEHDAILRDATPGILTDHIGKPTLNRKLGSLLRSRAGRHYGDHQLHLEIVGRTRTGVTLWRVLTHEDQIAAPLTLIDPAHPAVNDQATPTDTQHIPRLPLDPTHGDQPPQNVAGHRTGTKAMSRADPAADPAAKTQPALDENSNAGHAGSNPLSYTRAHARDGAAETDPACPAHPAAPDDELHDDPTAEPPEEPDDAPF